MTFLLNRAVNMINDIERNRAMIVNLNEVRIYLLRTKYGFLASSAIFKFQDQRPLRGELTLEVDVDMLEREIAARRVIIKRLENNLRNYLHECWKEDNQ